MSRLRVVLSLALTLAAAGCGKVKSVDESRPAPGGVVTGAGRMEGGRFTLEVELGSAVQPGTTAAAGTQLTPGGSGTP